MAGDNFDADVLVIGSGFGGAVTALRLAEAGLKVRVLEQGQKIGRADIAAAKKNLLKLLWLPALGLKGFFAQHFLRHVGVVAGVGVGGGSLVWGSVLLRPREAFFDDPAWSALGVDWRADLAPCYAKAEQMLGRVQNTRLTEQDQLLHQTATAMGAASSFEATPVGIYFGQPAVESPDPYFAGAGPARTGCRFCGGCLTGCEYGSKNSLDYNYLHLAQRAGAVIQPAHEVTRIMPLPEGGYRVESRKPGWWSGSQPPLAAPRVVVAAGVIGTLRLLFAQRERYGTLPNLSARLGTGVRTNSEAIVAVLHPDPAKDLRDGVAISSHFFANPHTHITQNRFPDNFGFQRFYLTRLVDGTVPAARAVKTLLWSVLAPLPVLKSWLARHWAKRITVLTVMQHLEGRLTLAWRRGWWGLGRGLRSQVSPGQRAPTYLPEANAAARALAAACGGTPYNLAPESIGNVSVTAHILGGVPMGADAAQGVIDTHHEVHGHSGLYVMDASVICANLGVNPSLTITALAERFAQGLALRLASHR